MPAQQTTLDEQQPSELFEGLLSIQKLRESLEDPPTERTIYRWMRRGVVAWTQLGDQRFIDIPGTRELLLARVRRPDRSLAPPKPSRPVRR
jgi:hypothetical protein